MDILIARGKHHAVIIAKTERGAQWIANNITKGEPSLTINSEYAKDLAEAIEKEGLDVEVH